MEGHARQIGVYAIEAVLGRGFMGSVYLARHPSGERCALKVMASHLVEDPVLFARFEREIRSLISLDDHPGIVRVFDAGRTPEGLPYYAMEVVEGASLKEAIKRGLEREQALTVVEELASALAHAHAQGIVHRDLKPENVLVDAEGHPHLTDFGLALSQATAERLTRTGDVLGTPAYMAPEQVYSPAGEVGPWSDVYSLGAILYELLVGTTPHQGETSLHFYTQLSEQAPIVPPRERGVEVDPALERVCMRALTWAPAERYQDAGEFAAELAAARHVAAPAAAGPLRLLLGLAVLAVLLMAGSLVALRQLESRGGGGVAHPELLEALRGKAKARQHAEVLARAGAVLEEPLPPQPPELAGLLRDALAGALAQAQERGQLEELGRTLPATLPPWLGSSAASSGLALMGRLEQALALCPVDEPETRARLAAWAGQAGPCAEALAALPPTRGRALGFELRDCLPGLTPPAARADASAWGRLVRGEELLATGLPELALGEFQAAAEDAGAEAASRLAARVGVARTLLALGEPGRAHEAALQAASEPGAPLERATAQGWAALAIRALEPDDPLGAGADDLEVLARAAPGSPLALAVGRLELEQDWAGDRGALAHPPLDASPDEQRARRPWRTLAAARLAAHGSAAAGVAALSGAPGVGGFARVEAQACGEGADGPAGLLLARAWGAALAARAGADRRGAEEAARLLALAGRLRPASPALWWARAEVLDLQGQHDDARAAARRASTLAPGDPELELLALRLDQSRLDGARHDLAMARLEGRSPAASAIGVFKDELSALAARAVALAEREDGRPVGERARLAAARAQLEIAWAVEEEAGPARARARELVAPLLAGLDVEAAAAQALRWEEAYPAGRLTEAQEQERALLDLAAATRPVTLEALLVAADAGHRSAARAFRALSGDAPAGALLRLRSGGGGPADRALDLPLAALARARALPPADPARALEAAAAVAADPDLLGPALAELGQAADPGPAGPFQAALAEALLATARKEPARAAVAAHEAALREPGCAAAWSLRARALRESRPDDPAVGAAAALDLRLAAAAAPAAVGPLLAALETARGKEALRPLLDALLARGFLWRREELVARAGDRSTAQSILDELDRLDPDDVLPGMRAGESLRRVPAEFPETLGTVWLLLAERAWMLGRGEFPHQSWDAAAPACGPLARAWFWLDRLEQTRRFLDQSGSRREMVAGWVERQQGPRPVRLLEAARFALLAWEQWRAVGQDPEHRACLGTRAAGIPERGPTSVERSASDPSDLARSLREAGVAQGALASTWWTRSSESGAPLPDGDPWDPRLIELRALSFGEPELRCADRWLAAGDPGAAILALRRAAGFHRGWEPHQLLAYVAQRRLREWALRSAEADVATLRATLTLLEDGLGLWPEDPALRALHATVLLDLVGLAPEGSPERQALLERASAEAEAVPPGSPPGLLESKLLGALRRIRARAARGDQDGARQAFGEGPEGMALISETEGARSSLLHDPLLPLTRRAVPQVDAMMQRFEQGGLGFGDWGDWGDWGGRRGWGDRGDRGRSRDGD